MACLDSVVGVASVVPLHLQACVFAGLWPAWSLVGEKSVKVS